jgi:hypothetical protein
MILFYLLTLFPQKVEKVLVGFGDVGDSEGDGEVNLSQRHRV